MRKVRYVVATAAVAIGALVGTAATAVADDPYLSPQQGNGRLASFKAKAVCSQPAAQGGSVTISVKATAAGAFDDGSKNFQAKLAVLEDAGNNKVNVRDADKRGYVTYTPNASLEHIVNPGVYPYPNKGSMTVGFVGPVLPGFDPAVRVWGSAKVEFDC